MHLFIISMKQFIITAINIIIAVFISIVVVII